VQAPVGQRVHHFINHLSVLDRAALEHRFTHEAGFFEHAHRGRVPGEYVSLHAVQLMFGHEITREGDGGGGADAAAPPGFPHPVTELGCFGEDPLTNDGTDAANDAAVYLNGQVARLRQRGDERQPLVGVFFRIDQLAKQLVALGCAHRHGRRGQDRLGVCAVLRWQGIKFGRHEPQAGW